MCACPRRGPTTEQFDDGKGFTVLGDLAGTAPLREALLTTNALLEQVLEELRVTNGRQLETVAAELRAINAALARTPGSARSEHAEGDRASTS